MTRDYIPRPNADFNNFQHNIATKVAANAVAWNIPNAEVNALSSTSAAYGNIYNIISNKGSRTMWQVHEYNALRKTYEADLRKFVNSYLRNNKNIEAAAFTSMGIPQRGKRRKNRSAITDAPELIAQSVPGAFVRFWCRQQNHDGRASIHPESDGVEIRYSIGTEPVDFNHAQHTFVSKKAHIRLPVKLEWRGKNLYAYARWVNLADHNRSSGWSYVVVVQVY